MAVRRIVKVAMTNGENTLCKAVKPICTYLQESGPIQEWPAQTTV